MGAAIRSGAAARRYPVLSAERCAEQDIISSINRQYEEQRKGYMAKYIQMSPRDHRTWPDMYQPVDSRGKRVIQ